MKTDMHQTNSEESSEYGNELGINALHVSRTAVKAPTLVLSYKTSIRLNQTNKTPRNKVYFLSYFCDINRLCIMTHRVQ